MGSGASKKKSTKPNAGTARKSLTTTQSPTKQNPIPSIRESQVSISNSETLLVLSPSVPNEGANARRNRILSNGTEPPALSYQQNNSSDDDEIRLVSANNSQKRSSKSSLRSNASTEQIDRCSFCPHCKLLPPIADNIPTEPPPVWFIEPPPKIQQYIIMDNYDEQAVRKKLTAKHGRLPGSYDYLPHLTLE